MEAEVFEAEIIEVEVVEAEVDSLLSFLIGPKNYLGHLSNWDFCNHPAFRGISSISFSARSFSGFVPIRH